MIQKQVEKFRFQLEYHFPIALLFVLFLVMLRITEYNLVSYVGEGNPKISYLFSGVLLDTWFALVVWFLFSIINLLFTYLHIASGFYFLTFVVCCIGLNGVLVVYFYKAKLPLDESFYLFSFEEIKLITNQFEGLTWYLLSFTLFFILFSFLTKFLRKRQKKNPKFHVFFALLAVCSFPFIPSLYYQSQKNVATIYVNNRLVYFIGNSIDYFHQKNAEIKLNPSQFSQLDPSIASMENSAYPLMKTFAKKGKFANYFHPFSQKPNIVIIIVESLNSDFIGDHAEETGNAMPFLDSLKNHALYFPNFISTCQRTFNVLPASLASVPNSTDGNYTMQQQFTPQFSLPRALAKDYATRFYCGVDLNFCNMNGYLKNIGMEYLVHNWEEKFKKPFSKKKNIWGYPDGYLFEKSILDTKKQGIANKPRLDVFLTISTHGPYVFPKEEFYVAKNKKVIKMGKLSPSAQEQLYQDESMMASYRYLDDELKNYITQLKKEPNFENTLFFIYGDHGRSEYARNPLSKFHTPLLIYSPKLKEAKRFNALASHVDITPTILQFLKEKHDLPILDEHCFVGKELNFSADQRKRTLPILSINGTNEHLLNASFFYSNGNLYALDKHFNTHPISNEAQLKWSKHQLKQYTNFSKYCFQNRLLTPEMHRYYGFSDVFDIQSVTYKKKNYSVIYNQKKFIPLTSFKSIPPQVKKVRIKAEVDYLIKDQDIQDMIPVFCLSDYQEVNGKLKKVFWKSVHPVFEKKIKVNAFNKAYYELTLNLADYEKLKKNNRLYAFFLFYTNLGQTIEAKDTKITIYTLD